LSSHRETEKRRQKCGSKSAALPSGAAKAVADMSPEETIADTDPDPETGLPIDDVRVIGPAVGAVLPIALIDIDIPLTVDLVPDRNQTHAQSHAKVTNTAITRRVAEVIIITIIITTIKRPMNTNRKRITQMMPTLRNGSTERATERRLM